MPLQVPAEELSAVRQIIRRFPNGASVGELLALPEIHFPKRTLQRRLDQLVSEGRLTPKGEGRARRYLIREIYAPAEMDPPSAVVREEPRDLEPEWLSLEARAVRKVMSRPVNQRTPVAYNGHFLDAYEPNRTFYLPAALRDELVTLAQKRADHAGNGGVTDPVTKGLALVTGLSVQAVTLTVAMATAALLRRSA